MVIDWSHKDPWQGPGIASAIAHLEYVEEEYGGTLFVDWRGANWHLISPSYVWTGLVQTEAAPEPEPEPPAQAPSGGFIHAFEGLAARRRKRKRELEEAEEAALRLKDAVDREIALLMQERERKREFQDNVDRLKTLVAQFADREAEEAMSERVSIALSRAIAQESVSAYLALQRELDRMLEEEEMAIIILLNDQ